MNATIMTVQEKMPLPSGDPNVGVEELPAMSAALARAFGELGVGGKPLEDVFSQKLKARCLGCGIQITGSDLAHLSVSQNSAVPLDSKLDRLRLGYCARNGCSSKYYQLSCDSIPGIDTSKVLRRAMELRHGPPPELQPEPESVGPPTPWFRQLKWQGLVALILLVAIWAVRYAASQGFVPGIAPRPHYQSAPESSKEAL
jgi:hypothetical protein